MYNTNSPIQNVQTDSKTFESAAYSTNELENMKKNNLNNIMVKDLKLNIYTSDIPAVKGYLNKF